MSAYRAALLSHAASRNVLDFNHLGACWKCFHSAQCLPGQQDSSQPHSPGTALCKHSMSSSVCLRPQDSKSRVLTSVPWQRDTRGVWNLSESSRSHQRLGKKIYTALAASFLPVTGYGLQGQGCHILSPPPDFLCPAGCWCSTKCEH